MRALLILSLSSLAVAACAERPQADAVPVAPAPPAPAPPLVRAPPPPAPPPQVAAWMDQTLAPTADRARLEGAPLYRIELELDDRLFTYRGHLTLRYTHRGAAPLDALQFLLYPNTPELTEAGALNLAVHGVVVDGEPRPAELQRERLRVPLAAPLAPGAEATVDLDFDGVIFRLPRGAADLEKAALKQLLGLVLGEDDGKGGYGVFSVGDGIVSLALWYPILAAHDGAGWDNEPGGPVGDVSFFEPAHYEVVLRTAPALQVASTGVRTAHVVEDDQAVHTFRATGVREFALQLSAGYSMAARTVDGVLVRSWFLDTDREAGERVLDHASKALQTFNRLYGPYPYPELDLAASPLIGGAGGVEFPSLVTIARMFYGGRVQGLPVALPDSPFLRDTLEFVVAHEVAHQWWNAVVGSDSKRHPFVDEALANHAAVVYFEQVHGPAAADRQRALQLTLNYQLARLTGAPDRPVDRPTRDFDDALSYAATVYAKGALFFDALRAQMGPARFDAALRQYYADFAFRVASPDDLIGALAKASDDPAAVRALAQRWLHEAHGDADIPGLDVGQVLGLVLGEAGPDALRGLGLDPRLIDVLQHRGAAELGKLLRQLVDPDAPRGPVDEGALLELVVKMLEGDQGELARMLSAVAQTLARRDPNARLDLEDASRLMIDVTRQAVGDDPDALLMLDVADVLLRTMERMEER